MNIVAFILSLAVAALGIMGMLFPTRLAETGKLFLRPGGLFVAAAIRITLGAALYLAAPASRAPGTLMALGIFIIITGFITPLFGRERASRMIDWWTSKGPAFMRLWGALASILGLFLAYAVMP
jgi:hypothetical protein